MFNDAVFVAILLTIFNDFTALLTRKTLIFAGRRSVLSTFGQAWISYKHLDFNKIFNPKSLQNRPWETRKFKKSSLDVQKSRLKVQRSSLEVQS